MTDSADQGGLRDAQEAADYVAEMTADLAKIARRHHLDMLGYLLDMARLEAENSAGRSLTCPPDVS